MDTGLALKGKTDNRQFWRVGCIMRAGAAPLTALMQEQQLQTGKCAGVILCGGNIDMPIFRQVLDGQTPTL